MSGKSAKNNIINLRFKPKSLSADEHGILLSDISENALKVLDRLNNAGYKSYLVGGCVRDLLLKIKPKDFDVVTDAKPEQIRELFRNCRIIGRRFRLAHVHFGEEVIEVSTFRAPHQEVSEHAHSRDGRIIRDNVYGDIDDDVWRRDFTVNAMFLNISDGKLLDYAGGMSDLENRQLRMIGEPEERYREDPVRMLRAVRFAAKLDFKMHATTAASIFELNYLLEDISSARLYEEFIKLFVGGKAAITFNLLREFDLFKYLFPQTDQLLNNDHSGMTKALIFDAFSNTDQRLNEQKPVTPAFLIAAILWAPLTRQVEKNKRNCLSEIEAVHLASDAVISKQVSSLALPRRHTRVAREIWNLQGRFEFTRGRKPYRLLAHPRFRAAYDFLLLREQAGEMISEQTDWWTEFQAENYEEYKFKGNRHAGKKGRFQRRRKFSSDRQ